jgi:NaMN:DMB phosphoribosyltransferase
MNWTAPHIQPPCPAARLAALDRQAQLTKPPGSLGLLEDLAVRLAAMQRRAKPALDRPWISVLARQLNARLEVVDAGVAEPLEDCEGLCWREPARRISPGKRRWRKANCGRL